MNINERFGRRVKALRNEKRLSQEKLAELSDLHRTYINLVESGKRNIALKNIDKIAHALEVDIYELFTGL